MNTNVYPHPLETNDITKYGTSKAAPGMQEKQLSHHLPFQLEWQIQQWPPVLPDGDIPVCAMLGPVVLEVHWCREIMAFSCQPAEQLCERTATHLPSPHAGVAPVGHHRKWVHGHAHGAAG